MMTGVLRVGVLVYFEEQILRVEEFGGMDEHAIVFNSFDVEGKINWKIQAIERVFFRVENTHRLLSMDELSGDFTIVNSIGDEIGCSENLRPEFVIDLIRLIEGGYYSEVEIDPQNNC